MGSEKVSKVNKETSVKSDVDKAEHRSPVSSELIPTAAGFDGLGGLPDDRPAAPPAGPKTSLFEPPRSENSDKPTPQEPGAKPDAGAAPNGEPANSDAMAPANEREGDVSPWQRDGDAPRRNETPNRTAEGEGENDGGMSSFANTQSSRGQDGNLLRSGVAPLVAESDETGRWGRDDLNRGEIGSRGETLNVGVGQSLRHLTGLGDEEPGHRNGEKLTIVRGGPVGTEMLGVGSSIEHLWLLGDFEYTRASGDVDKPGDIFPERVENSTAYPSLLASSLSFSGVEDNGLSGVIFHGAQAVLPVTNYSVSMNPAFGTIVLNADGTFDYTPTPEFSGIATFSYEFTDPRTGIVESGTATITVAAVVDEPSVQGAATTPEDVLVPIPVTVNRDDMDGSETIDQVVVTGIPAGAVFGWDPGLPGSVVVAPDGSVTIDGTSEEIEDILASLEFTPPQDFSGDITLDVAVTVTESNTSSGLPGHGDTTTVHHPYVISVEPVADNVTVTGDTDEVTPEDTPVQLDELSAGFGDLFDGSEVHSIAINGVHPDAVLTNAAGVPYPSVLMPDGTHSYTLTQAELADVFYVPPYNESGTFGGMTIVATAVEPNGDTQTATAPISVEVTPVADIVTIVTAPVATDEDTAVTFGDDIAITINDPLSENLTSIVVSGFPEGTTVAYNDVDGTPVTIVMPAGGSSVTLTGGTEAEIRTALGTMTLTPPLHTDDNIALTVAGTTTDIGGVTRTDSVPMNITVNAVADAPSVTGAASGLEDQPIALPIAASLVDADGTETYDFASVTPPAGVTLILPATLPDGITSSVSGGTTTFTPGAATTPAQFEAFLATGLQVQAPLHSNDDFDVAVVVGTIESAPTEAGEVTLLRNETPINVPVEVLPVNDLPTISGASTVDEDATLNLGADIVVPASDDADGSESITAITLLNFPAGVVPNWTDTGGAVMTLSGGVYTISGGTEADIQATLDSVTVDLSQAAYANRDDNFTIQVSVTTTDVDDAGNPAAVATTALYDHEVTVNAVADVPNVTGDAETTDEDTAVLLDDLAGSLNDTDLSETLTFEIRGVDAGVNLMDGANAGTAADYPFVLEVDGTRTYSIPAADIGNVWFHPPANVSGTFAGMTIAAIATEHTVAGEPHGDDVAEATAPISVVIAPVADFPAVSGASLVDEDQPVNVGANITIDPISDADGSEVLSGVTMDNLPVGAAITYTPVGGGMAVTTTVTAGATSLTFAGGTEADIRTAVASFTLTPPPHSDANIPLEVTVETTDAGVVTTSPATIHDITVNAVADAPSVTGAASGLEDQPIALPITASLVDADGTETYDFASVTPPAGVTLILPATLPDGIISSVSGGTTTFTPGAATTPAQFEAFLATGLQVQAPLHSNDDFDVAVVVGTIESAPTEAGEVTLLRNETPINVPVEVLPVNDLPTISGASTVDEDATLNLGTDIVVPASDDADGSETITAITLQNFPAGVVPNWTDTGGAVMTLSGGVYTISGGTEADIQATLDSVTVDLSQAAYADRDENFTIQVSVTTTDVDDAGNPAAVATTALYDHEVTVNAVADTPTLTLGTAVGLEDQNIPVSFQVGDPDTDGTESIKEVVISSVPAGFGLTSGVLADVSITDNGGGSYTISYTGAGDATANDAAINAALAALELTYDSGVNPRQHLDTEFDLDVQVTTIENNPTEGEVTTLEATGNFTVPVTVTAVADGVTTSGSSVLVEDVDKTIGSDIAYTRIDNDGTESVSSVAVTGFPEGATVSYTDVAGVVHNNVVVGAGGLTATFSGGTEAEIRAALDTLRVTAPLHSDVNFDLDVEVVTDDNDSSSITQNFPHTVVVQAVADAPTITANAIVVDEDASVALSIDPTRSADSSDGSESLSVRITIPADGGSPVGTLSAPVTPGITFEDQGGGVYLVSAAGATAVDQEAALDAFLGGSVSFTPRAEWSGVLIGPAGIKVEAISTEAANGYGVELGPNNDPGAGTGGDVDTKVETDVTYFDVTVNPVIDVPVLANSSTIVQENNNSSSIGDPDLVVPIGSRLGLSSSDLDGSETLSLQLSGFPTNAQALAFATTIAGVTTNVNIAAGTVDIAGPAADVATVLASLSVTLADDRDENFTVAIDGTTSDTNGVSNVAGNFSLTHDVVVQAAADMPTVDVGAAVKPTVLEDSGFAGYGVNVNLNDIDGSETYESVVLSFSTPGAGALPEAQFGVTAGVAFDTSTAGQVVLTGAAADIEAAMASLQMRPGANNGEDITVTVTATAVESNPAEPNLPGGGGVNGSEISLATATTLSSFVIPVTPVPETPTLTAPANASGLEDTSFALGAITVDSGGAPDTDNSESYFLEIETSSYPAGTQFTSGGAAVGTVVGGWLRIPEADFAGLQIQAPTDYSGAIDLSIRGVVVDTSASDTVTTPTAAQPLTVQVDPVADPTTTPVSSIGVEDLGPVAFGAVLADTATGITVQDTVVGGAGSGGDETLSQIVLDFPADTATQTYSVTPGAAVGTAAVTFDAGSNSYTITSSIITGAADLATLTDAQRDAAEADIRATLAGFEVEMGPTHTDLNGVVTVTATALDVKDGVADTLDTTFDHDIVIQAVADTPTIAVTDPVAAVAEDGAAIPLVITAGLSPDQDGSEVLSVRVTVPSDALGPVGTLIGAPPANVTMTSLGGGAYLIEATGATPAIQAATLNGFLSSGDLQLDPRNDWSGELTGNNGVMVEAISTEAATGAELADDIHGGADGTSATETVVDYIDVLVDPVVDTPSVKGNAIGLEDTVIPVPTSVTLGDNDGSETYSAVISGVVPPGTTIYGDGGRTITPGVTVLTEADIAALAVLPPLHHSSIQDGDIVLTMETTVVDDSGATSVQTTFSDNITIEVTGVADAPAPRSIAVVSDEDEPLDIGAAIVATGGTAGVLVDGDGSEGLSFVISGLPSGVIPTSGVAGGISYLGGGAWQVSADAVTTLALPAVPQYAGDTPYPGLTLQAVTQEKDGDQAVSAPWPIDFTVHPRIDEAGSVDGFGSWDMGVTVDEGVNEAGPPGVSLANVTNHTFIDTDGSESVVSYTFDLNGLIADAEIATRLEDLAGAGAGLPELVAGYISGTFAFDAGTGLMTVDPADIAGVALSNELFADSNVDFSIPVTALVRDEVTIGGVAEHQDKVETGSFNVNLVGDADTPTAFANSVAGNSGTHIPISLGGVSTDNDVALGRALSEDIHYIVRVDNFGAAPLLGFTDAAGNVVGLSNGDGTWLLTPADLAVPGGLHVYTPGGSSGTAELTLITVATENDGDVANNTASFTVDVTSTGGSAGTPPLPPTVSVGPSAGNEDGAITLNVTAAPAPGDPTNPAVSVMISDLPAGATIEGATFNSATGRWVASGADVNAGLVTITPPADFSGTMPITIEAVAVNSSLQQATTGAQAVNFDVDPVADGVVISSANAGGDEDAAIALDITLDERDVDGSEDLGAFTYITLSDGATLLGGYAVVAGGDPDAIVEGVNVVGAYRVPTASVAGLQMQGAPDWHGSVTVDVVATSVEPLDDNDGDNIAVDTASFSVNLTAVADAPSITVPATQTGAEDTAIALPGLSAALEDAVTDNGAEMLSTVISGIPEGSILSAGSNNGDGSWTIPVASLAGLSITPPLNYAGTMTLTLTAISLELSNGSEAQTSLDFDVNVTPVADDVLVLAENVTVDATGQAPLVLNVRMPDDRGDEPGELSAELAEMTFTSVPDGMFLFAGAGGTIVDNGGGEWVFTGTMAEANALQIATGPGAVPGGHLVDVSTITIDGADQLGTPVTDSFQLSVAAPTDAGLDLVGGATADVLNGGAGNDILSGGAGADQLNGGDGIDRLIGGQGADVLTGGNGSDLFSWESGDPLAAADSITDFVNGAGGDQLDISQLLSGFDMQTSAVSDFVQAVEAGGDTTIRVDVDGAVGGASFTDLVVLEGVVGVSLDQMQDDGNIVL